MTDMMRIVTIGALLHDIGKAIIRASGERKTHSQLGADFLRPFCGISEAGEAVVRCVRYHHGRDLRGAHLTIEKRFPRKGTKTQERLFSSRTCPWELKKSPRERGRKRCHVPRFRGEVSN